MYYKIILQNHPKTDYRTMMWRQNVSVVESSQVTKHFICLQFC